MKSSWGARPLTTAVAAFCLTLPLWLASCAPIQNAYDAGPAPAAAPEPRPAPPVSPPEEAGAPTASGSDGSGPGFSTQGGAGTGTPGTGTAGGLSGPAPATGPALPSAGANPAGTSAGTSAAGGLGTGVAGPDTQAQLPGGTVQQPAPASGAAAGPASAAPTPGSTSPGGPGAGTGTGTGGASGAASAGTAVYYVAIDDGGRSGVRFGCNDSLVAVHNTDSTITEPLHAAMSRLLSGPGAPPASGLYNALSASSLQYVSGYLDGTTVVVNLTGAVQPGGVCDLPRIEAQLTHTAVTAVGAVRAEIYVSGVPLADVLGLH
ncbi:GerMN domain-containing protein [Arthrobacter globiformis]|uniref:GerMN domain-containing protein n=1 Tax=Arthrobacter globiformis TaxID=1665 RepID=UPI00397C9278